MMQEKEERKEENHKRGIKMRHFDESKRHFGRTIVEVSPERKDKYGKEGQTERKIIFLI